MENIDRTWSDMAGDDRVTQILIDQLKMQNELTRAMKDEIHQLSNSVTALIGEMRITRKDLEDMDKRIDEISLKNLTFERDLRKLEPFIKAGDIVKGLIIKALAYGALVMIFFYIGREVEWAKLIPFK